MNGAVHSYAGSKVLPEAGLALVMLYCRYVGYFGLQGNESFMVLVSIKCSCECVDPHERAKFDAARQDFQVDYVVVGLRTEMPRGRIRCT